MLIYEPNPKHETPGSRGVKGTKLDLSDMEATLLLNDPLHCLEVPGRNQRIGVRNGKIYCFKKGSIGYHAYPISGNELCAKFPEVQSRVATLLGTSVKRLSQMRDEE
jgi:hypothetical protein